MKNVLIKGFPIFIILLLACTNAVQKESILPTKAFNNYWYQGLAEINVYKLEQARYGELRHGEAELIYVTEDFSEEKLVKLDQPEQAKDKVPVLKLNMVKKFHTGVYPYSMMTSVFSPINDDLPIKLTTSSQEWCGHTFLQIRKGKKSYTYDLHSYFESEGEQKGTIGIGLLEDGTWNAIRMNPATLPVGGFEILPSTMYMRLMHKKMKAYNVRAKLEELKNVNSYTLVYPELDKRYLKLFRY